MDRLENLSRLFLNIYWLHRGDRKKVRSTIEEMLQVVTVISKNAVTRLNIMCKSDAFSNAYVKSHNFVDMIIDIETTQQKYFAEQT